MISCANLAKTPEEAPLTEEFNDDDLYTIVDEPSTPYIEPLSDESYVHCSPCSSDGEGQPIDENTDVV